MDGIINLYQLIIINLNFIQVMVISLVLFLYLVIDLAKVLINNHFILLKDFVILLHS